MNAAIIFEYFLTHLSSVLTANSAAYELTGLKKAQFTSTYFIFDIIHKDDAIHFVKVSDHYCFALPRLTFILILICFFRHQWIALLIIGNSIV